LSDQPQPRHRYILETPADRRHFRWLTLLAVLVIACGAGYLALVFTYAYLDSQ
jgi:hypothetical protein